MARVLLVAPTCDGEDVGEAWVAFQWASRLAQHHDLTVLTYFKRGKTPLSKQLQGARVVEWQEPPLVGHYERLNSMLKPAYLPFYARARYWIRRAIAGGEAFDAAHQPVPVAMRYPSPLTRLGIPYIIGPVGGGLDDPPHFDQSTETAPWFTRLRTLDSFRLRHDPLLRRTYQEAACVLGIAPYVFEQLAEVPLRRFEVMSETGLPALPPVPQRQPRGLSEPFRLLYVGRLVKTKGARYAVEALSRPEAAQCVLDVVGDGPDRDYCEQVARQNGVTDRVVFHGALPRREVDAFYLRADAFVFPSYREPGGNVTFEAMGYALPVVVCDRGGPGATVDPSCAVLLKVEDEARLVRDLASAMGRLAADRNLAVAMGRAGRARVERTGLWEHRIERFNELARELMA